MPQKAKKLKELGKSNDARVELARLKEKEQLLLERQRRLIEAEKLKMTQTRAHATDERIKDYTEGIMMEDRLRQREEELLPYQQRYEEERRKHDYIKQRNLATVGDPFKNAELDAEFNNL